MKAGQLTYTFDELDSAARLIQSFLVYTPIICFVGGLGAGKTTLIQRVLYHEGIPDSIQSPTFTYFNQYDNVQGGVYYHFDLYRLSSLEDFKKQGFEEYLALSGVYTFIEWPELIMPLLKHNVCFIRVDYVHETKRLLSYSFKK